MNNNELKLKESIGLLFVEALKAEMLLVNNGVGDSGRYESNNPAPRIGGRVVKGSYPGFPSYNIYNDLTAEVVDGGVIINLPDYAIFIEKGRAIGRKAPPAQVILQWMSRVGIGGGTESNRNSIAYAIGQSIKRHGIKSRPFIQSALDALLDGRFTQFLDEDLLTFFDAEIRDMINRVL